MIFVCYPKCSTCQKAKKWLDEHHISYELRDIKEENPGYEELAAWHQRSGLPLKRFFNTSGLLYKSMGLKDKLPGHERGGDVAASGHGWDAGEATAAGGRRFRSGGLQGGPVGRAAGEAVTA